MRKTICCYIALLLSFNLLAQTPPQPDYETITDLTFTDIDGETHNLYSLLNEGYRVILDFGFIGCGPCALWAENIGPVLWDEYGPDGDNSLRIFYFEVGAAYEDSYVDNYYSDLGVEYPIITSNFHPDSIEPQYQALFDADILDGAYPVHVFVCQDTTYRRDLGYAYPTSLSVATHILDHSCNGQDLHHKDVEMIGLRKRFSYCSENSGTITYRPELHIYHNGSFTYQASQPEPTPEDYYINDIFHIKTYINNTHLRTDTLDPTDWSNAGEDFNSPSDTVNDDDDEYGQGQEWRFQIPPIEVEANDSVKFELIYPEDSYLLNNTASFKVETDEAKTASSNLLRLAFGHSTMFVNFYANDQVGVDSASQDIIIQEGSDTLLTINNGQCYAMSVINASMGDAYLIQSNNNDTLFHHKYDGTITESQYYYFNVDARAASVEEQTFLPKRLSDVLYYDILGKLQKEKVFSDLPNGIYLRVSYYTDGTFTSDKVSKITN